MDASGTSDLPTVISVVGTDDPATLYNETVLVARAAEELGLAVPRCFKLLGLDEDGNYAAVISGSANDLRCGAAILARLRGRDIVDCLAEMNGSPEHGSDPAWAPPVDLSDNDAVLSYLEERQRHPEWPRVYNGPSDWAALLGGGLGAAAIARAAQSIASERIRSNLVRYLVDEAREQGVLIDPAEVIRALTSTTSHCGGASAGHTVGEGGSPPAETGR